MAFIAFFLVFAHWRRKWVFYFRNGLFLVFFDNIFNFALNTNRATLDMFFTRQTISAADASDLAIFPGMIAGLVGV